LESNIYDRDDLRNDLQNKKYDLMEIDGIMLENILDLIEKWELSREIRERFYEKILTFLLSEVLGER